MSRSNGPTKAVPPIPTRASAAPPAPRSADDRVREAAVRSWIESVTGIALGDDDDLCAALRSGITLCTVLNRIRPGLIKKINRVRQSFLELENIGKFVLGARALGVPKDDVIQAGDLCDAVNPGRVVACLVALAQCAEHIAPDLPRIDLDGARSGPVATGDDPNARQRPSASLLAIGDVTRTAALESQLKRRQSSILLQREVDNLRDEKAQLDEAHRARVAQLEQLQAADRDTIDQLQVENERAALELEQMRAALAHAEIDLTIQKKQAEADRLLAMAQQQRAVQDATDQLERRLTGQHRRDLDQLQARSQAIVDERRRRMEAESRELEATRTLELEAALRRIAELEQGDGDVRGDEIARVRHEARVRIAVEGERTRLEADQRAIEQVRLQAERAKQAVTYVAHRRWGRYERAR